jgi:DNA-binding CsgD family transcriptional regulator
MPENTNRLTPKQIQCLSLVADGMTSKEIARALGLSARTVDDHVEKARIKLNAHSRQRAAAIYRGNLLAEQPLPLPERAPYQIRCEPPALDGVAVAEPIELPTPRLSDGGSATFEHFPLVEPPQPASPQPKENRSQHTSPVSVILRILTIAAAIALIALAYPQLVYGAEKIAGFILTTNSKDREAGASR